MEKLPLFLKKYFWEVEFKDLNLRKNRIYIIKRILEYGDEKSIVWLWKRVGKSEIENVLVNYRGFSRKSANYWALMLGIPRKKVRCLNKLLPKKQKILWPY